MSSTATVNGERVIRGQIVIPSFGLWTADLELAVEQSFGDAVTVAVGTLSLAGTVVRVLSYGGARSVRVVGGKGGWRKTVDPKAYAFLGGVPASMVLGDLAREVGETLSLDGERLLGPMFVRRGMVAGDVLSLVVGAGWFVQPDGTTKIGARASSSVKSAYQVTQVSGAFGRVLLATEDAAAWVPGAKFTPPTLGEELTVSTTTHRIDDGTYRTEVLAA